MMIDIYKLTAAQILAIPADSPERLYTGSKDAAHEEHKKLAAKWHPREDGDDSTVSAHINALYDLAIKKLEEGTWSTPGRLRLTGVDGKVYEIRYKKHRQFELGDIYIGDKIVVYSILKAAEDLFENAVKTIKRLDYADDQMRKEISRFMPIIQAKNETADRKILVLSKPEEALCLRDVLEHFDGKLDPKHSAWLMSRLYNLACYLRYSKLTHNDISPDTVFIDPNNHSAYLLGGWWYATKLGADYTALPERTVNIVSPTILNKGKAELIVDSALVRATGREALGDLYGSKLNKDKSIPKAMLSWVLGAGTDNVREEYSTWYNQILKESFGPRKFVELKLTSKDIYKEIV